MKSILRKNGCSLVRQGRGDHEVWYSPISDRRFVVDGKAFSRHTANKILKQAGVGKKL
ncbi:MAG: type II toxin-antitoxin system HicA family toxin [Gammaproteobacteria bacterium]|nr:type II toxin-antitoxin system HicA family toxin [Gammaproteobacteria bacterium]